MNLQKLYELGHVEQRKGAVIARLPWPGDGVQPRG